MQQVCVLRPKRELRQKISLNDEHTGNHRHTSSLLLPPTTKKIQLCESHFHRGGSKSRCRGNAPPSGHGDLEARASAEAETALRLAKDRRRQKNGGAGRGEYTASRDAAGEVGVEWERDKQMAELKGQGLAWQAREGGEVSWCVAKALLEGSGSRLGV